MYRKNEFLKASVLQYIIGLNLIKFFVRILYSKNNTDLLGLMRCCGLPLDLVLKKV